MKTYKGYLGNGEITLTDKAIIIKKGLLTGGAFKGEKTIPLSSITAVDFKSPGLLTNGYIWFMVNGVTQTSSGNIADINKSPYAVIFTKKQKEDFLELKNSVESKIG